MKRSWSVLSALLVAALLLSVAQPVLAQEAGEQQTSHQKSSEATWVVDTVDSTQCFFANVSLTMGPGDVPHISYYDSDDEALKHARRLNLGWRSTVVDNAAAVASSIDLDSSDRPHIAYRDGKTDSLKYASWDGQGWAVETVAPGDQGWEASLKIDSGDVPHIAYLGIENNANPLLSGSQRPKYANRSGETWKIGLIQGENSATTLSMALDSMERPHVGYNLYSSFYHGVYSDTAWMTDTVDSPDFGALPVDYNIAIAIDDSDGLYISYPSPTGLALAHRDNTGWISETVDGVPSAGVFNSLDVSGDGHMHLAFFDAGAQAMKYAYKTGQTWAVSAIESPLKIEAKTSLALDSTGQPHVAYCDTQSNTVKYARQFVFDNQVSMPLLYSSSDYSSVAGEIAYLIAPQDGSFYHIYAMNADGSKPARLSVITEIAGFPVWSPDGTKIAFDSLESPSYDIYVMDANGLNQVNLTNSPGVVDSSPSWSLDGSKIVFDSSRYTGDNRHDIYVMNADGSNMVRLTDSANGPWWDNYLPAWSPDGTKIAVEAYDRDVNHAIYVMNADGTNKLKVTDDGYSFPEGEAVSVKWIGEPPIWSPDSTRIAFVSDGDGNDEIYVVNADGTNLTNLTNHPGIDRRPTWSPDGTRIAFSSDRADGIADVFVMNADGTDLVRLTTNSTGDGYPTWSPDSKRIAFVSDRDGEREIYVMNADGTNQQKLTSTSLVATLPSWSP